MCSGIDRGRRPIPSRDCMEPLSHVPAPVRSGNRLGLGDRGCRLVGGTDTLGAGGLENETADQAAPKVPPAARSVHRHHAVERINSGLGRGLRSGLLEPHDRRIVTCADARARAQDPNTGPIWSDRGNARVRSENVASLASAWRRSGSGDGQTVAIRLDRPDRIRERAQRPAVTSLAAGALIVTGWSKLVRVIVKLRLPAVDEVPAIWTWASW